MENPQPCCIAQKKHIFIYINQDSKLLNNVWDSPEKKKKVNKQKWLKLKKNPD